MAKRGRERTDGDHVFLTRFWRPWSKDAVAEQFRKLCRKAGVPCHGFYRLRHCASTAISLVTGPHVQRRFLRHSKLQQQIAYTHTPDTEVDAAITRAKEKLLGISESTSGQENGPARTGVA
jgi:integrase